MKSLSWIFFFQSFFLINSIDFQPVPPQPSQYQTSIIINGISGRYYADTTIYRDRLDQPNEDSTLIIDFERFRQYIIRQGQCTYSDIPGKISPLLAFSTYQFNGNVSHDHRLSYQWSGCHYYEIPPAPYNYYSSIKENLPEDLILPTIDVNIHFENFTYGPPSSSLFDLPTNCTQTSFDLQFHPIRSQLHLHHPKKLQLC